MKTLFHGSERVVETPKSGGKTYNDFGVGFYCTEYKEMAMEWAVGVAHDGFANAYFMDPEGLEIVDFDEPGMTVLHWLSALLQHRFFDLRSPLEAAAQAYLTDVFSVDFSGADIVCGCRADDSFLAFAEAFLRGEITYRQLCDAVGFGAADAPENALQRQIVLRSERAFGRLEFIGFEVATRAVWLPRRMQRDKLLRSQLETAIASASCAAQLSSKDLFIGQIIEEEVRPDDERLR